jgi:hypothetical protein
MAKLNLLDVAKLNGTDQVVGLIEENLTYAPEVAAFPARSIRGTSFYTVKRTGFPSVAFRKANEGVAGSKSTFEKQLHECYILSSRVECDKAVATAYEGGMAELEMIEASGVMKQALIELGSQIWYGTTVDAKGFPGLKAITPKNASICPAVLDATGAAATTASSVYAVKFGAQNVEMILGNNASFDLSPFRDESIADSGGTNKFPGRVADLTAWCGLAVGNVNCVGRICNLTAENGKTLSDSLISQLLEKFPVGYKPDALFMSRRSAGQLQRSRTVTLNGGPSGAKPSGSVELVAPWPTSAFDIPIIVTDSILNTDAIE